jgi:uncharacterized membrane protein
MCERFLMRGHDGPFIGFGPFEGLFGLLILGLIAAGVVVLIINLARSSRTQPVAAYGLQPPTDPALEAVRMRYARGEISREEYAAVAADLEGKRPQGTS